MWSLRLNLLAYWQYYMYIHIIDPSSVFSLSGRPIHEQFGRPLRMIMN